MPAHDEAGGGRRRGTLAKVSLSSVSAAMAEASTYPLDAVKTRLQLHRGPGGAGGGSVIRVAAELARDGGVYRGFSPAVLRHLMYTPLRIVGYEHLRSTLGSGGREVGVVERGLAGGLSGIAAQVLSSPADLIKIRMQADSRLLSQGIQPRYTGIADAFTKIIRAEGFLGLWKGVVPNAQRAFLVNMGELASYDQAKHLIIRKKICDDNIYGHTLASVASGLSTTTLSCPADVIKTRMMNQGKDGKALYRNSTFVWSRLSDTRAYQHCGRVSCLHGQGLARGSLCSGFPKRNCAKHQVFHHSDNGGQVSRKRLLDHRNLQF